METNQATPRLAHSWATHSPVTGGLLRRFVGSMSFPSFLPTTRYTRPRLPSSGSLGSHFPTFFGTTLGYDYHLFLSVPSFRSVIDTLLVPFVRVLSSSSLTLRNICANARPTWSVPVRLFRVADKETFGSLKFPGYPFEHMPRSSTPVVS